MKQNLTQHPPAADNPPSDEGYQRGLSSRQVQMMAISGAIGVGLFYGTGAGIEEVGPSLIACYAGAGLIVFLIMRALGELITYRPTSGSFADYAREFFGPFAGYLIGWSYWAMWVAACMAEVTAAGHYINFWWPTVPVWVTAAVALSVLFVANLISVKLFGELEFWFSTVKIVAIVGMMVIGIGVISFGFSSAGDTASVTHLWRDGGFAPHGVSQSLLAMQGVIFAYLGSELVGVTAGEAQNPKVTLRKAINALPLRIGIFYVGSLTVIMSVMSWKKYHASTSPFVQVFTNVGIPAAASVMNFVVLTAALSSCNSGIYTTGRMLRSLAVNGEAPQAAAGLNSRRLPVPALVISAAVMALGILVNVVSPDKAFIYITSVGTSAGLFTWVMILAAHLRYRARVKQGTLPAVDFRMPGAPVTNWIALLSLVAVFVLIARNSDTRVAVYVGIVWCAALGFGYRSMNRNEQHRDPRA